METKLFPIRYCYIIDPFIKAVSFGFIKHPLFNIKHEFQVKRWQYHGIFLPNKDLRVMGDAGYANNIHNESETF